MLSKIYLQIPCRLSNIGTLGSAAVEFALLLPMMVLLFLAALQLSQAYTIARDFDALSHTLADITSQQTEQPNRDPNGYLDSYYYANGGSYTTPTTQTTTTLSLAVLDNIFGSAAAIMSPYSTTTTLTMTVTAVDVVVTAPDSQGNGGGACCQFFVRWSYSTDASKVRPCGILKSTSTGLSYISPDLTVSNVTLLAPASIIISDATYTYVPVLNGINLGAVTGFTGLDMTLRMSRTQYVFPRNTGQIVLSKTGVSTQPKTPVITNMQTSYPSIGGQQALSSTSGIATGTLCY